MKPPRQFIDAEIVILSPEEGGRATQLSAGVVYQGRYMPHIVLQPREIRQAQVEMRQGMRWITDEYHSVAFWNGPDPIPNSIPFIVTMLLMHTHRVAYDGVVPGAEFTIREGGKIIGHGTVLNRVTDSNA
jgi:hypothetical protein